VRILAGAAVTADVALGALAAVGAAGCYETSYVLQALEARRVPVSEQVRVALLARLLRRRLYLGAIGLAALGWPLQLLALSLAPLTLVQPIIALGVVLLLVLASRTLHERIGHRELAGCAGVITGVIGIVLAAPEHTTSHGGPAALALALGALGACVAAPYALQATRRKPVEPLLLVLAAGAGDAWGALGAKLFVDEVSVEAWAAALGFGLASAAAVGAGLLSETSALQRFPAARVGPAVVAMQVAIPVVLAPLVAGERWSSTPLHGGVVLASLLLVTVSAVALTASRAISGLGEHERGSGGPAGVVEVESAATG